MEDKPCSSLLPWKTKSFIDYSHWHSNTMKLHFANKDIRRIWMHKQALMLIETTRSISLFADMWAWNNDIVFPQPEQITGLDKESNRRWAVLHHKAFDGKHKSTALSDHSLNMLEKTTACQNYVPCCSRENKANMMKVFSSRLNIDCFASTLQLYINDTLFNQLLLHTERRGGR